MVVHRLLTVAVAHVGGARALGLTSFRSCGLWALECGLSTSGAQAWVPHGIWDLWTKNGTGVPCIARQILTHWTP